MDVAQFESLLNSIRECTFALSKRKVVKKSQGFFTGEQIRRILEQFTDASGRREVLEVIHQQNRIIPLSCVQAADIVKLGIYSGDKLTMLRLLANYITDKHNPLAWETIKSTFSGSGDKHTVDAIMRQACQATPAQYLGATCVTMPGGHLPPVTRPAPSLIDEVGFSLFGGIMQARSPPNQRPVGSEIRYQPVTVQQQQTTQPSGYNQMTQPPPGGYFPVTQPGAPPAGYYPAVQPGAPPAGYYPAVQPGAPPAGYYPAVQPGAPPGGYYAATQPGAPSAGYYLAAYPQAPSAGYTQSYSGPPTSTQQQAPHPGNDLPPAYSCLYPTVPSAPEDLPVCPQTAPIPEKVAPEAPPAYALKQ